MAAEKKTDYTIEAQQNLMRIVQYLATDVTRVVSQKELEEALELSYSKVNFCLHNLRMQGWAEQVADGWRLSSVITRISENVRKAHAESLQRYLGGTA